MSKLERFFIIGLVVLVVLAVVVVIVGPRLGQRPSPTEQPLAPGETETMAARVIEVLEEGTIELNGGGTLPYQRLLLRVEDGSLAGQEVEVEEGTVNIVSQDRLFHAGDRVYLERAVGPDGDRFYVSDFVRTGPLFWLGALFAALIVLVGRGRGFRALLGTTCSVVILFAFILPQILAGRDPVLVSIVGAIVMLTLSTYITYGWNPKAHAAMAGMAISLTLTGLLAWLFVGWTRLTGMSEESSYLVMEIGPGINLRGLALSGVIIGSMGALDDIVISQASVIFELVNANRELSWTALFRHSLNIGRDHIAGMVNTLLLAYVGASMPLMLVFSIYQEPLWRRVNREPIAEEIVRTLVGSIGLVLAVPITSLIASLLARWMVQREEARGRKQGDKEQGTGSR